MKRVAKTRPWLCSWNGECLAKKYFYQRKDVMLRGDPAGEKCASSRTWPGYVTRFTGLGIISR